MIKTVKIQEFEGEHIGYIINGNMIVPLDPANRHYAAIMEMVDAGTLTIAEADNGE